MWQLPLLVLIVGVTGEEGPQLWHLSVNSHHPTIHRLASDAQVDVWGNGRDHAKVLVERSAEETVSRILREADISHYVEIPDVFTLIEEERKHMDKRKRRKKRQASLSMCTDKNRSCEGWAVRGECQKNSNWMHSNCPKACNLCDGGLNDDSATGRTAQRGSRVNLFSTTDQYQMDWDSYHKLQDIQGFIFWLNATYPNLVTVSTAGVTNERRTIYVLRVTDPSQPGPKKRIWIEGGIHAREWISPAVTTYLLHQVTTNPKWKPILAKTEWFFVPVANPDGYHYSFTSNKARLWRKNRNDNGGSNCKGVDLNRNWDMKWGVGASEDPCSDLFMGKKPFSEKETQGLANVMKSVAPIDLFITFHSYGQAVLYPYGWTNKPPPNAKSLNRLAHKFADTVNRHSNGRTSYEVGGSGPTYGLASGATDDWAYGVLGSPFSYTLELPDTGRYGFMLPENLIGETVVETEMGMYCMVGALSGVDDCVQQNANQPTHSIILQ